MLLFSHILQAQTHTTQVVQQEQLKEGGYMDYNVHKSGWRHADLRRHLAGKNELMAGEGW